MNTNEINQHERSFNANFLGYFPIVENSIDLMVEFLQKVTLVLPDIELSEEKVSDLVCRNLFYRLVTDFIIIKELVQKGYCIQAMSLLSSTFECVYLITYISKDNEKAKKWFEHDNRFTQVFSTYDCLKNTLKSDGLSGDELETETERIFSIYGNTSSFKHINNNIQAHYQMTSTNGEHSFHFGPRDSVVDYFICAWTLNNLIFLILTASRTIIELFIDENAKEEIIKFQNAIKQINKKFSESLNCFTLENNLNLKEFRRNR